MSFRALPDDELNRYSDERLLTYARQARDEGQLPAGRRAIEILLVRYGRDVKRRVAMKVTPGLVEDLVQEAFLKAIAAAFDGSMIGQFRSWLHTIVDRTVADHYRRLERRPKEQALPSEHQAEEEVWGAEPAVEDEAAAVELSIIVEEVLEELSDLHRRVIELHVFGGLQAGEVSDRIGDGMTPDNVAQIASRFRRRLRERLDPELGGGP